MHKLFSLMVMVAFLSGCAGAPPKPSPVVTSGEQQNAMQSAALIKARSLTVEQELASLTEMLANMEPDFTLGRGDVLSILVYDEPDLSLNSIPVGPNGHISLPLVGSVKAEGLTPEEFTAVLTQRLSEFVFEPQVSVMVLEFKSIEFTIFGEVVSPGVYPLETNVTITEAIARAGGLNKGQFRATTVELADLTNAFISRNGKVLPVNFIALVRDGDMRFDIELFPGDFVYIPSGLSQEVYILGEIAEPMAFAYRENMPMSRTMAMAEGFTKDADITRVHIVRGTLQNPTLIVSNFEDVLRGRAQDVALQPGDIIYIPPKGLATWSRMMDHILPTMQTIWTGMLVGRTLTN